MGYLPYYTFGMRCSHEIMMTLDGKGCVGTKSHILINTYRVFQESCRVYDYERM